MPIGLDGACVFCICSVYEIVYSAVERYKRQIAAEFGIPLFAQKVVDSENNKKGINEAEFVANDGEMSVSPLQLRTVAMTFLSYGLAMSKEWCEETELVALQTIPQSSCNDMAQDLTLIILLEKDLNVLVAGVKHGHITHGNTTKYISLAVAAEFGNVVSVLVATSCFSFDPLTPIQLLMQNLLSDISRIFIPWEKIHPDMLEYLITGWQMA